MNAIQKKNNKKFVYTLKLKDLIIQKAFLNALEPLFEGKFYYDNCTLNQWRQTPLTFISALSCFNKKCQKYKNKKIVKIIKIIQFPIFSKKIFGLRYNKNTQALLQTLKKKGLSATYYAVSSFEATKAPINLKCFFSELRRYIANERVIIELRKMIRTCNVNLFFITSLKLNLNSYLSSSILSPFLSEVYLNILDKHLGYYDSISYQPKNSISQYTYRVELALKKIPQFNYLRYFTTIII